MQLVLFSSAILTSSMSFAVAREQAACVTSDSKYEIKVHETDGSLRAPSVMTATVTDADGKIIFSIPVQLFRGFQSVSFGRPVYRDIETSGDIFTLKGRSTNFSNYILDLDPKTGLDLSDKNLNCSIFLGQTL